MPGHASSGPSLSEWAGCTDPLACLPQVSPGRKAGLRPPTLPMPTPIQVAGVVAAAAFYVGKAYLESTHKLDK